MVLVQIIWGDWIPLVMATFWVETAKKRVFTGYTRNVQLRLEPRPPHPCCCCLTSPGWAHACEGTDPASPASSLQEEFNQYLPALRDGALVHKAAGWKGRASLAAVGPAVPAGAASGRRSSLALLSSRPHTWLPNAKAEGIPCAGTRVCLDGSRVL